ncbi:hypothetical protein [Actinoplanes lobatus]|uniref:Uncharacterized protein n=1 Tax=Actinoplanes lobatus TaxID=113568 RepID=A0A7W7MJR4_9ACTN|nr:hypothetical protein [Actinoplanes lobatus]MBB4752854.1 hypothetical protein [Actinoplanes lobatus]
MIVARAADPRSRRLLVTAATPPYHEPVLLRTPGCGAADAARAGVFLAR